MTKVIVFDIDGTLANIEHRRAFVATKPKNWKAFNAGIVNDTPHEDIVWLWDQVVLLREGEKAGALSLSLSLMAVLFFSWPLALLFYP